MRVSSVGIVSENRAIPLGHAVVCHGRPFLRKDRVSFA